MMRPDKGVMFWLYSGMFLIFVMVMVGGITRLTESGLSIVNWEPISGSLPPLNEADWQKSFELYKQTPQFKEINSEFKLADYQSIFWWEYIHRTIARLIGIVFIVPFAFFLWKKRIPKRMIPSLLLVFGLGAFQGFLGWFMVSSGLDNEPRVSHFRLAAHLITAFITIGYIYWIVLRENFGQIAGSKKSKQTSWAITLIVLVGLQILYGAFVAGTDSGMIHNTWPSMNGYFIHPAALQSTSFLDAILNNHSTIQFIHRMIAICLSLYLLVLWLKIKWLKTGDFIQKTNHVLLALLFVQFCLGVFTLVFSVPIVLAVLHQFFALLLLLASLRLLYGFRRVNIEFPETNQHN